MPDPASTPTPARRSAISDDDLLADAIPIDVDGEADDSAGGSSAAEAAAAASKIRAFSDASQHQQVWKRKTNFSGQGATHVKTFVSKLRLEAIEHLDEQINEWLDDHPDCEVKLVTTSVGNLVGKNAEPALFVNVWV